ncbi:uncharacterized protein [Physcomitrium patens]|uniref:Uncharacterized protein n=1 Tax=Physcomitrium patens TaxID=3218 RepID=A0A2K1JKW7_PHYPA|nr:uncharacterized protein LOC112290306 [Physcomitrium patens]PNR42192.1 hypothetical protein PHYPA_017021 [Physcomitrium patens]|eukprot:XP_024392225.1 uncharacterized protein LOC112290306 [Physcomitrella patens]
MKDRGMLFSKYICAWQPVRVMHGDGHVRSLTRPVTVGDLLKCHPHHFVCKPSSTGPLYHSSMLPSDMELEEGRIYLLLPLPRLLPNLSSALSYPPSCPCFSHLEATQIYNDDGSPDSKSFIGEYSRMKCWIARRHGQFQVAANTIRMLKHRVAKSKIMKSLVRMSKRTLPERLLFRLCFQKLEDNILLPSSSPSDVEKPGQCCSRNRWRPGLECISEIALITGLLRDSEVSER